MPRYRAGEWDGAGEGGKGGGGVREREREREIGKKKSEARRGVRRRNKASYRCAHNVRFTSNRFRYTRCASNPLAIYRSQRRLGKLVNRVRYERNVASPDEATPQRGTGDPQGVKETRSLGIEMFLLARCPCCGAGGAYYAACAIMSSIGRAGEPAPGARFSPEVVKGMSIRPQVKS